MLNRNKKRIKDSGIFPKEFEESISDDLNKYIIEKQEEEITESKKELISDILQKNINTDLNRVYLSL